MNDQLKEIFKQVNNDKKYQGYQLISKQIENNGKMYTEIYELLKSSDLTASEKYALFIMSVRNTLTCLKRIENLIERDNNSK